MSTPCCEYMHVHEEVVKKLKKEIPSLDRLYNLTELFKCFGDITRMKILYLLFEGELCVCDISMILEMTQSAISHQLKVLKNARLVKFRKEKTVFYSLGDQHVKTIISQALKHIDE